jgi:hypothetical protein
MFMPVAGFVKVNKVFRLVRASVFHPNLVMGVQFFSVEQVFTAYWTFPILVDRHIIEF